MCILQTKSLITVRVMRFIVNSLPGLNKLLIMHNHFAFTVLLTVGLILNCHISQSAPSSKINANGNVFKLLLGLYKINPLKGSPVFQTFSNNLLMGMGRSSQGKLVLNFESGESVKINNQVKMNLNEIEKMIHTKKKKPAKHFVKPAYDLDDVSTENFKADLVLDDTVLSKEALQRALLDNHNINQDFSALFEHIESNEIDTDIPVTKLLPVKDTNIRYSQVSNQNEAILSQLTDSNGRSVNHIGTHAEVHDRNPKELFMGNLVEDTRDVIVF